jgi:nuclear pore complex protein Nup98-Nup96
MQELRDLDDYSERMLRRDAVGGWLGRACRGTPPVHEVDSAVADNEPELAQIFDRLTVHDIAGACDVACRAKDYRLALLLSQAGGGRELRRNIREQLVQWSDRGAAQFINANRLNLYALLAGCLSWPDGPEDVGRSVCQGLDWKRTFGVHLWYRCPATAR